MSVLKRKRHYIYSRRAYTPRLWPAIAVAIPLYLAIDLPLSLLVLHGITAVVGSILLSFSIATLVNSIQWTIWRRRHPIISGQEIVNDFRRQAPWN